MEQTKMCMFYFNFYLILTQRIIDYCFVILYTLHSNRLINLKDDSTIFYTSGICFPHSCKSIEIAKLFQVFLKTYGLKQNVSIDESDCSTNDPIIWTTRDRIALYVQKSHRWYDVYSIEKQKLYDSIFYQKMIKIIIKINFQIFQNIIHHYWYTYSFEHIV